MADATQKQPSFNKRVFTAGVVGGVAGAIEICCTYPTEFVKTQLQLDSNPKKGQLPKFNGSLDCIKKTVFVEGKKPNPLNLYKGLSPLLFFSVPKATVRFAGFEIGKQFVAPGKTQLTTAESLQAGLLAGALEATFVVCPQETIKVKFVHDTNRAVPKYKGLVHGCTSIYKELGMRGLYAGYTTTLMKQSTNQAIRFGVMISLKNWYRGDDPNREIPLYLSGIFGGIAGAASVFGNTPIDVIKTRMQGLDAHLYKNSWDCTVKLYQSDGLKGFYKGTVPRMGRVVLDVAIVFTLFDYLKPKMTVMTDKIWTKAGWD